ncbi:MAG: exodeoxyribonuclease V subunit alpha [Candidatus Xenobiia bacterium LiM19]
MAGTASLPAPYLMSLEETGFFEKIDLQLGRFIVEKFVKKNSPGGTGAFPEVITASALVCRLSRSGHTCIPLDKERLEKMLLRIEEEIPVFLDFSKISSWSSILIDSSAAITSCEALSGAALGKKIRPLVVDEEKGLLYIYRYWAYENMILERIRDLQESDSKLIGGCDTALVKKAIASLFSDDKEPCDEGKWRGAAAATAALRRFTVITGGPGTGKTTTVARVLALLLMINPDLTIAVAAPTGKAAARIGEAVAKEKERMVCGRVLEGISPDFNGAELLRRIPSGAATIHRLLGSLRESPYFRHNSENPLPYDVVVIDEASMVDLPLMAKTMDALGKESRLILLGDKSQLASVEIGVVFGDICSEGNVDSFSSQSVSAIRELSGLEVASSEKKGWIEGCIVELKENFRFDKDSGIARLSTAVNRGDGNEVMDVLKEARGDGDEVSSVLKEARGDGDEVSSVLKEARGDGDEVSSVLKEARSDGDEVSSVLKEARSDSEIKWITKTLTRRENLKKELKEVIVERYKGLFEGSTVEECFKVLESFKMLSPLRKGPFGVVSLNGIIEEILWEEQLIPKGARYYKGKPLIVMKNDYGLHLYNGDAGVISSDEKKDLRAYFPWGDGGPAIGGYRGILPGRLPEHETVYAMTVHKSQGSEFDEVLLILPPEGSPVLTRELLYTAITRARKRVEIWGGEEVIRKCVAERIERVSGMEGASGIESIRDGGSGTLRTK